MGGDTHLGALPLRQYEVALQHADKVLSNLLQQPSKPWICFGASVRQIAKKAQALREQAAACAIQRAFRRWQTYQSQRASVEMRSQAVRLPSEKPASKQQMEASICSSAATQFLAQGPAKKQRQADKAGQHSAAVAASKQQPAAPKAAAPPRAEPAEAPAPEQRQPEAPSKEPQPRCSEVVPSPVARPPVAPAPPRGPPVAPVPPRAGEATGALNPIEKRRQLVASQLAVANPSRLSRNRRLQMEQSKRSSAAESGNKSASASAPGDSRQSTPRSRGTDKKSVTEARPGIGLSDSMQSLQDKNEGSGTLATREEQNGYRCTAAETGGFCGGNDVLLLEALAGSDEDELECSTGGTPVSPGRRCRTPQEALDGKLGSSTPQIVSPASHVARAQCASPRKPPVPPHNVAPRPGTNSSSSRGPPVDLLLKDNLPEEDPLEFTGVSMGCSGGFSQSLSMAPPPSSRPQSPWRFPGPPHAAAPATGKAVGSRAHEKLAEKHAEDDVKFFDGGMDVTRLGTAASTAVPSATFSGRSSPDGFLGCETGSLGLKQFR